MSFFTFFSINTSNLDGPCSISPIGAGVSDAFDLDSSDMRSRELTCQRTGRKLLSLSVSTLCSLRMALIYLVAGEVSGDLHGAELILALKKEEKHSFAGWGGTHMAEAGGTKNWVEKAGVMGIWDVLSSILGSRHAFTRLWPKSKKRSPRFSC